MLLRSIILCSAVLALVAGCSSAEPPVARVDAPSEAVNRNSGAGDSEMNRWSQHVALPQQTVQAGSCGLFLWANTAKRALVFYASDGMAQGTVMLDGKQTMIPRTQAHGETVFGHFSRQTYKNDALQITLSYRAEIREGLHKGAVVRDASMRVVEASGWEIVMPVAGLIGCN